MRLKLSVFLPGEDIFHIGDVGHEMYFITKVRAGAAWNRSLGVAMTINAFAGMGLQMNHVLR
jgi:hypothetical protein